MRVVLDSNVIVAAFAARGICSALFEYCIENDEVVLCDEIVAEVGRVLVKKVGVPKAVVRDIVAYLRDHTEIFKPRAVESAACRDKSDLPVLGVALSGSCGHIVTGDTDLLSIGEWAGVKIVSPRKYWQEMRRGKPK
jgi:putative PIN family toxin of toxin-antitoxin system